MEFLPDSSDRDQKRLCRSSSTGERDYFCELLIEIDDLIRNAQILGMKLLYRLKDERGDGFLEVVSDSIDKCLDDPQFKTTLGESSSKRQLYQMRNQLRKREEIIRIAGAYCQHVLSSSKISKLEQAYIDTPLPPLLEGLLTPPAPPYDWEFLLRYILECTEVIDANVAQAITSIISHLQSVSAKILSEICSFTAKVDSGTVSFHENSNKRQIYSIIASLENKDDNIQRAILFLQSCLNY